MRFFLQNPALQVFYPWDTITSSVISEKLYDPFWRKCDYRPTYLRTGWQRWFHWPTFRVKPGVHAPPFKVQKPKVMSLSESSIRFLYFSCISLIAINPKCCRTSSSFIEKSQGSTIHLKSVRLCVRIQKFWRISRTR